MTIKIIGTFILSSLLFVASAHAEDIGSVDTAFKLLGPDHKILVEVFDDPKVQGVSCYVSRAKTGGITGAIGLAEDKSNASIACRQIGEISFKEPIKKQEDVFSTSTSILFKKLKVIRMVDPKRQTLTYLTYSERC